MSNSEHVKKQFTVFFKNKGNIGPIAEKSVRNFRLLNENPVNKPGRIYHFAIGHVFKNIDTKKIFELKPDEQQQLLVPTKYLAIQKTAFTFSDKLNKLIDNIRNINSHYIHKMEMVETKNIDPAIILFLKESFELAVIFTYLDEQKISYDEYLQDPDSSSKLTTSLCNKFYPNETFQKEDRNSFLQLNFKEAIDHLLFIENQEDLEWSIFDIHPVMNIPEGKYLSFYSCLFLLSMFLYKDEAIKLISRIGGFKRSEDKFNYKRAIFTFFAKKFTSQDIDNEEQPLVRFRDIIQYLNHYPTVWNSELELESRFPLLTENLKSSIIKKEIFRSFPDLKDDGKLADKFLSYATTKLFGNEIPNNLIQNNSLTEQEIRKFENIIETSPELKDAYTTKKQLDSGKVLSQRDKKQLDKLDQKIRKLEQTSNPVKDKLEKRIREQTLFTSYGRNQDRFMEIGIRLLAERNYFGSEARFKMYVFKTMEEQEKHLEELRKRCTKKELDQLKYHQGRLVEFKTYQEQLSRYTDWDTPFVIENNAVQVAICLNENTWKNLNIQRDLLIYLLEDILYNYQGKDPNGKGKTLFTQYYFSALKPDVDSGNAILNSQAEIHAEHKTNLKKLFPKRLLHHYNRETVPQADALPNHYELMLEEAVLQEKRYAGLLGKAVKLGLEQQFTAKNKGKQFKFRFIKKAWNLMYFKAVYLERSARDDHHKSFHITREEFNDFSRWMYAFDEVPEYKTWLDRFFNSKQFFRNPDFRELFDRGNSLDDWYRETKILFREWLDNKQPEDTAAQKYLAENYKDILHKNQLYVNIQHFVSFLKSKNRISTDENRKILFRSLGNIQYLVEDYYCPEQVTTETWKANKYLLNKLRKSRLEDALLYEIAIYYLNMDANITKNTRANVAEILNSTITFDIKNTSDVHLYTLSVPFSKIEALAVLISHKTKQENDKRTRVNSFLGKLNQFLLNQRFNDKEISQIAKSYKTNKNLYFDQLNKINNYLISWAVRFSEIEMKFEEYLIFKHRTTIQDGEKYIDSKQINELETYIDKDVRNEVLHFDVPEKNYKSVIEEIETSFIQHEIKPNLPTSFDQLTSFQQSVCLLLMKSLHANLFIRDKKKDAHANRKMFYENYFEKVIKKIEYKKCSLTS